MSSEHILVVDDDDATRTVMAEILEDEAYVVTRAARGDDAVLSAKRNPLDLVILDLSLPGEDAHAVAHDLKGLQPGTRILAVSARPSRLPALPHPHFDAVLAKPFDLDDFLTIIQRLGAEALLPASAEASVPRELLIGDDGRRVHARG